MNRIYITGTSGTGKTTLAGGLIRRGIKAISIDEIEGLCGWFNKETGIKVDYEAELNHEFINSHEWECDIKRLKELMGDSKLVVVLGIASNQEEYLHLFDQILLLQCSSDTFIKRILSRTDNDFGKDESAQKLILDTYQKYEKNILDKGAIAIDVEQEKEKVLTDVLDLIFKENTDIYQ